MCRREKKLQLRFFRIACVVIGILEATGALLWSFAGAGIYGSPIEIMLDMGSYKEVSFIAAIILFGPGLALWAGLTTGRAPCRAAVLFGVGASLSLILGARYQDMGLVLAGIISLPMTVAALFAFLLCRSESIETKSSASEIPATSGPVFQFRLGHLMIVVTVICVAIGLAIAHANAARYHPPEFSPFCKSLMKVKTVPGFVYHENSLPTLVPIPAGSPYISRMRNSSSQIPLGHAPERRMSVATHFILEQNFLPREQRLPKDQLMLRLKSELEEQLTKEEAQIIESKITEHQYKTSTRTRLELNITYRWRRISGLIEARMEGPSRVDVKIKESTPPGFLMLSW